MKRVLALILVLGLASSANALYLEIDGTSTDTFDLSQGSTASISIISEDNSSWLGYIVVPDGSVGMLSNPSIFDDAGNAVVGRRGELVPRGHHRRRGSGKTAPGPGGDDPGGLRPPRDGGRPA